MLQSNTPLSMAATAYTPWIDCRHLSSLSVFTDCGAVNTPVGVVTIEASNDVPTIESEQGKGTAPASSAAVKLTTVTASTGGTNWATGYDGSGSKLSYGVLGVTTAFVRLKYARTSGGAADVLNVRWFGKPLT